VGGRLARGSGIIKRNKGRRPLERARIGLRGEWRIIRALIDTGHGSTIDKRERIAQKGFRRVAMGDTIAIETRN